MTKRENKREEIRKAAVEVIATHGYYAATTDKMAQAAGVAVGTIYNYFSNKEEILEYIFRVEVEKRFRYYDALSNQKIPVLEKLRLLLTRHFDEIQQEPAVGQVMVRERYAPLDRQLSGIQEFIQGVPTRIQKLLDEAVKNGEIRPCDTLIAATALWGSVEAVVSRALTESDDDKQKAILAKAADSLIELYCRGLKKTD
ncbi:MAG: TetR/AcrR family transcriptional regulator [Firmicutes bacterium]|nr:TetR/AcrR family transcriptional regulator [Bacillota bacterium]